MLACLLENNNNERNPAGKQGQEEEPNTTMERSCNPRDSWGCSPKKSKLLAGVRVVCAGKGGRQGRMRLLVSLLPVSSAVVCSAGLCGAVRGFGVCSWSE